MTCNYSKTCVKWPLSKRPQICFQDQLSLNTGRKYCRIIALEHSVLLLPSLSYHFVIKIFVLSIFKWPFYTGFTVVFNLLFVHGVKNVNLCTAE